MVNGWAGGAVVVGEESFTPTQGEQLVRIIAESSKAYRNGAGVNANDIDWNEVDARARGVLSPEQFAIFKTMEPSLPVGGRYQSRLYARIRDAQEQETSQRPAPLPKG